MQRKFRFTALLTICLIAIVLTTLSVSAEGNSIEFGEGEIFLLSAPGAKGGVSSSLSPIHSYNGSDYRETRYDSSLNLSIAEQSYSTVSNSAITFHYSAAKGDFISALLISAADEILYYGRVAAISGSSGSFTVVIPSLTSGAYYLNLFPEKAGTDHDLAGSGDSVSLNILEDPYITTTSLPESTIGVSYSTQLKASTASSTITWSLVSGNLPAGLTLDPATGIIKGTPSAEGTFDFTVRATGTSSSERDFSITINPRITITFKADDLSGSSITIPKGKTVTLVAEISGGTLPYDKYSWQIDSVTVPGNSTNTITVDSSKVGTSRYTFSLIDYAMANSSASINITVREPIMPTVGTSYAIFDKASPASITFTKNDGDFNFSGNLESMSTLVPGSDFTINGNAITISQNYLSNLSYGEHTITIDYNDISPDPVIKITVIDSSKPPIIGEIIEPSPYNRGAKLSISIPSIQTFGSAVTSQGWKIKKVGAADFVAFDATTSLDCSYNNAEVYYYATNSAGMVTSNTVTIKVNHYGATAWSTNTTQHWHLCGCGEKYDLENHKIATTGGSCSVCGYNCTHTYGNYTSDKNATCTSDGTKTRTCSNCGHKDTVPEEGTKTGHNLSNWQVSDTSHWRVCTTCGIKSDEGSHIGGTATCTERAVCTTCGAEYGKLKDHVFNKRVIDDKYLVSTPADGEKPKYYYSCECGKAGTETFEACDNGSHVFTKKVTTSEYLASEATCVTPAKYYYSCEICGAIGTETFEHGGLTDHTPGPEPTYTSAQTCLVCGKELKPRLTQIILTPDDNNKPGDNSSGGIEFDSSDDISNPDRVVIDGVEIDPDDYEISEDGKTIIIKQEALDLLRPDVLHSIKIYVSDGIAEGDFSINTEDPVVEVDRHLPFWFLYIPPHFVGYLFALIMILIVLAKGNKEEDEDEDSDNE